MRTRAMRRVAARYSWERLRVSFWFIPALAAAGAVMLAWAMIALDARIPNVALEQSRLVLSGTVDGMRAMLISIATAMLTTGGIVFTLLTLPLSTVASQYGSRLLRVFQADRTTQAVLGMFVATFVYSIAAAASIPPAAVQPELPQLTVTVGLYLMLASFASLVMLVQHISTTLQAPNMAAAAATQLFEVLQGEVTSDSGLGAESRQSMGPPPEIDLRAAGYALGLKQTGYIQYFDAENLLTLAHDQNLFLRLQRKPGEFVWSGDVVALVWPAERVDERLAGYLRRAIRVGNQRTPTQDIECGINQLVEMAVRAMSPALNDPFTAMTCLDYLGRGLALFARQGEELPSHYDSQGRLRLVLDPVGFEELLGSAFDMLRHASRDNATVLLKMLESIEVIGQEVTSPAQREALLRHVQLIEVESKLGNLIESDRERVVAHGAALHATLREPSSPS